MVGSCPNYLSKPLSFLFTNGYLINNFVFSISYTIIYTPQKATEITITKFMVPRVYNNSIGDGT